MKNQNYVNDPMASYGVIQTIDVVALAEFLKLGFDFKLFLELFQKIPFSISEWEKCLNLSESAMKNHQAKSQKKLNSHQAEHLMQIATVFNNGVNVFGNRSSFESWLVVPNIALNSIPKDLLTSSAGIDVINQELSKISHGVFA